MALTERSRTVLYKGFTSIIDDEQAVQEMMSYFPARDVEEPATKEVVRAELAELGAGLRSEMAELGAGLRSEMAEMGSTLRGEMVEMGSTLRGEMVEMGSTLRREMAEMESTLRSEMVEMGSTLRGEMTTMEGRIKREITEQVRADIQRIAWINMGTLVAFAGVIIAAVRL